jgi:short-subunit dehydrogenase
VEQLGEKFRCALVTGSSSGLGLAFTQLLLDEGVSVIGLSRSPEISDAPSHYTPWALNLADLDTLPQALESIFEQFSEIDLVINNAGFGVLEHLQGQSIEEIEKQYCVMLTAPTLIAAHTLRTFETRGVDGCLLNVSSLAVELPLPLMPIYNSCKAGLSALSESLMLDASGTDKTYTVIDFRPGDFNTNFAQRMTGRVDWNGTDLREVMDRHHAHAPSVDVALKGFRRALLSGCSRTQRVGDFFQSKIAPLGPRLFPSRWLRAIIRFYYRS